MILNLVEITQTNYYLSKNGVIIVEGKQILGSYVTLLSVTKRNFVHQLLVLHDDDIPSQTLKLAEAL